MTRSLGCFFTEAGEFSSKALDRVAADALAPLINAAGGKTKEN